MVPAFTPKDSDVSNASWWISPPLTATVLMQHPSHSGVHLPEQFLAFVPVCCGVGFGAIGALQVQGQGDQDTETLHQRSKVSDGK